ncbi:MAG: hypothetical protein AAF456_07690 [Planctomycetota bacterium]
MYRLSRSHITALCACLLLVGANYSFAQEEIPTPEFGEGVMEEVSEIMPQLIALGIDDGFVGIERGWEKTRARNNADLNPEGELEELVQKYMDRGLPPGTARRWAEHEIDLGGERIELHPVCTILNDIVESVGQPRGGGGGGHDSFRWRRSTDELSAQIIATVDEFQFEFNELNGARRRWIMTDSGAGTFLFTFISSEILLDLRQDSDRTRLAIIAGDDARVFAGDSFSDLASNHPEPLNSVLFPLFDQLGFKKPLSFEKAAVLEAAIEKIRATQQDDMDVIALLDELNSDSFTGRDAAQEELTINYFKWEHLINDFSGERDWHPEAEERLHRIKLGLSNTLIHDFIDNRDLLNSPEALLDVYELADDSDKAIVLSRLEEITGESFGDDIASWRDWLER